MPGIKNYISEFGNKTFEECPLNDCDILTMSEVFYMPLEQTVSSSFEAEPKNFTAAANELFALRGFKHKKLGLLITPNASIDMVATAATKRFSEMKLYAFQEVYSLSPSIQYCAGTFVLPDGTLVVFFRGTDDTVAGWKEDADLFLCKNPPAYKLASEYIESLAANTQGNIILCGHSKGGNIALYTALKCSDKIRSRITGVYNFDGPGFHDYGIFHLGSYDDILPVYRHYIPSSSFIGVLLAHDYDYKAVKSNKHLGVMQHDIGTWQIENGELVTVPDIDILAKMTDAVMSQVCSYMTSDACEVMSNILSAAVNGLGQETLTDIAKHAVSSVKGAVNAVKDYDPVDRDLIKNIFRGTGKQLKETAKSVKNINTAVFTKLSFDKIAR